MINKHVKKAIKIAGGQRKLERLCNSVSSKKIMMRQQYISRWLSGIAPVGPKFVLLIERATDGEVSRYDLRPDLYPRD